MSMFNWKHMLEVLLNSFIAWKDKIRKNEKSTKQRWWFEKREKEKRLRWRKALIRLLKTIDASLWLTNDVCLTIVINDVGYAVVINDVRIRITTFGSKLWIALSSYVSLKSISFKYVAIKSFSDAIIKCFINAIVIANVAIKLESLNELKYGFALSSILI